MRFVQHRLAGILLLLVSLTGGCAGPRPGTGADPSRSRQMLIVLDGLRPDYLTPQLMPALSALGQRGVVMTRHHAVFPTVTRVNASSIATGAYPEAHGLLGNAVFVPAVDPARFFTTADRDNLLRVEAAGLPLLTVPTLPEVLEAAAGQRLLVASAGSSGSAYLLNHTGSAGATLHYEFGRPETLYAEALDHLGAVPDADTPNHARNRRIVDALLDVGLPAVDPAVTVLWLSDPDTTAHAHGIGHPLTVEALFRLDAEIALVATGPDLKAGVRIATPTGNVDLAPTFLHLLGVDVPPTMQGRVLRDALRNEAGAEPVSAEMTEVTVRSADGSYTLTAVLSVADGRTYLDYTTVERRESQR